MKLEHTPWLPTVRNKTQTRVFHQASILSRSISLFVSRLGSSVDRARKTLQFEGTATPNHLVVRKVEGGEHAVLPKQLGKQPRTCQTREVTDTDFLVFSPRFFIFVSSFYAGCASLRIAYGSFYRTERLVTRQMRETGPMLFTNQRRNRSTPQKKQPTRTRTHTHLCLCFPLELC